MILQLFAALALTTAHALACVPPEGAFFVDKEPAIVRWEYANAKKAPLLLPDLDAVHFTLLKPPQDCATARYGKDQKRVYFEYSPIPGADPTTFKALAEDYARDAKHVYYKDQELKNVLPESFTIDENGLAKDGVQVFYRTEGYPQKSMRHLGHDYFALGPHVLYRSREVYAADLASFEALAPGWARDRHWVFHGDERATQLDAASFKLLGAAFYGDKSGIRSSIEVANVTDSGIPGLDLHAAVPIEKSRYSMLMSACKDAEGIERCLIDGHYLIAIVEIPQLGSHEVKAANLSDVRYSPEGNLQFGTEIFAHLSKLKEGENSRALRSVK